MAQTNYTPISLYYSTTASQAPTAGNLVNGELAINITDGKLYYKDNTGAVKVIAGTGGTGVVAGSNTQIQFNNNGVFGASASLTWDGSFLTVASIKDSALTSGRVTYAGASGLLTDSANLTFNGTTLTAGGFTTTGTTSTGVLSVTGNTTLGDASADSLTVNATITSNLIFTDNTYDIGASGATRPRNIFVAGNGTFGGNLAQGTTSSAWSGYTAIDLPAAGYVSSGNSYMTMLMNAYYNGSSYVRKGTGSALEFLLQGGGFTFNAAASSTAGSTFSYSTIGYLQSAGIASGVTTLCLQNQGATSNVILSTTSGGVSNANIEYRANAHSFQIGTSEKLGVLNGGNIGIRTTNVIGAGNIFLDSGSTAAGYFEPYNSVTGDTSIVNTGNYSVWFKTNNAIRAGVSASGKFLVGTTTERNTLTVVSGVSAPAPTLGTASGSAFFGSANVLYGLMLGTDPSGPSWIQGQRVDGTATAYNLWLQPSGGLVTVGYASNPGVRMGVGSAPASNSYDGFQVLRAANGQSVVGLFETGSAYSYGSVGANQSWIYSNYGNLTITADGSNDLYFAMGNGSIATNRVKLRNNGAFTVLSGGASDNSVTGLILYDDGESKITALSNNSSRNLRISAENIAFWTGTTYASKATLYDNGCFSIGGTVNNVNARLILNGEQTYNDSTPGTTIGTMHFAGQLSADYYNAITWNGGTGTTGAQAGIYVQGSGAYGTKMRFATTDSYAVGSKTRMTIDQLGNIGAPTGSNIYNASDRRLKKNVQPITNALATIKALQSVAYNWIDGFCDAEEGKTLYGWVAQDAQVVDSNLVEAFGPNDLVVNGQTIEKPLRVNEKFVVPLLAQALKELTEQFEAYVAAHP